jgi:hypothetical protein
MGDEIPMPHPRIVEFKDPANPWPDNPEIPDLAPLDLPDFNEYGPFGEFSRRSRPSDKDIDEENGLMLRRQRLFRWAAQAIAVSISQLPEVQKLVAFGAVARPLKMEVPRFSQFRRHRIGIFHECIDLDLALWMSDLSQLKTLKHAIARGLQPLQDTPYGGVAHHQVDTHLFDAAERKYRGRLCIFGQCPKPGRRECLTPGCGAQPFLQQFRDYRFKPERFAREAKVVLFDRASEFLVHAPRIEGNLRVVRWHEDKDTGD